MAQYTHIDLETAACLWETVLHFRDQPAVDPDAVERALAIRKSCDAIGTAALRLIVVGWTDAVEAAWRAGKHPDLICLDRDSVTHWIAGEIDWSDSHNPVIRANASDIDGATCSPSVDIDDVPVLPVTRRRHLGLLARMRAALDLATSLDAPVHAALIKDIHAAETAFARSPLPWPIELHAAAIHHRYGANIHAAIDEASLDAEIADWCRIWWKEAHDDRDPAILDDQAVISAYFEHHPFDRLDKDGVHVMPGGRRRNHLAPSLEEGRYCVLSTAHLTVQTADLLDKWAAWPPGDRPIDIAASTYGWFVPALALDANRRAQIPEDLLRLIDFGRDRAFQFLLFDCDGDRADDLPIHDW